MTIRGVFVDVLLVLAVLLALACSLGVALMGDVYQKLHFLPLVTLVAPVLVALAVLVQQGYSENTVQTLLALFFLVVAGPLVSHATARAARIREAGDWRGGSNGKPAKEETL